MRLIAQVKCFHSWPYTVAYIVILGGIPHGEPAGSAGFDFLISLAAGLLFLTSLTSRNSPTLHWKFLSWLTGWHITCKTQPHVHVMLWTEDYMNICERFSPFFNTGRAAWGCRSSKTELGGHTSILYSQKNRQTNRKKDVQATSQLKAFLLSCAVEGKQNWESLKRKDKGHRWLRHRSENNSDGGLKDEVKRYKPENAERIVVFCQAEGFKLRLKPSFSEDSFHSHHCQHLWLPREERRGDCVCEGERGKKNWA